jgi:hypothetical protein
MGNVNKKQWEIQICQIRPNSPNLKNAMTYILANAGLASLNLTQKGIFGK